MLGARRACYKCGNLGHYAEVCSSAERLCYNCKQPGHESNQCPLPRTTETKQCYHCQGLGHVQADCPTLRISASAAGGRCYVCNQPGHMARVCPNAPMRTRLGAGVAPIRPAFAAPFGRPAMCYKCGGPNHFARDCQAQAMKCYSCGKLGHISRDCTAPNGGPLSTAGKVCYKCSQGGHISRDCPLNAVNAANGVPVAGDVTDVSVAVADAPVHPAPTLA